MYTKKCKKKKKLLGVFIYTEKIIKNIFIGIKNKF